MTTVAVLLSAPQLSLRSPTQRQISRLLDLFNNKQSFAFHMGN